MTITCYENVTKRINSTYRPTGEGIPKDVKLKEPTDFMNPVFILDDMNWNINYVQAFGMYYRVTNRVLLTNNLQELHCKVDSLATGKDYITGYSCFVERSASQQTNYLDDNLVSVAGNMVDAGVTKVGLFGLEFPQTQPKYFDRNGCFLIRVIAPPPTTLSSPGVSTGIVSYAIDRGELYKLLNYAFDENNFQNILADASIKAVFNPLDYLVDIKWLPISATDLANNSTTDTVYLGWFPITTAVGYPVITRLAPTYVVPAPVYEIEFTLDPTTYYNDFKLVSNRFTKCFMYIPGVGSVDIDASYLLGSFKLKYSVDRVTGDAFVELYYINGNESTMIGRYSAQLSCKINLAQASVDMQGVVSNIVSGTANVFAENYTTAGFQLVDVVTKLTQPTTRMIGENGSMGALSESLEDGWRIYINSYESCDQPNTCGKPLYKNKTLGDLSGFIKCGNASLSTPYLQPINEEINQLLNGGFYLE